MKKVSTILILILCSIGLFAQYTGKITKIYDGNTFWVDLSDGKTDSVKFYGIDCPELDQQYGVAAKGHLESQLHRKVEMKYKGRDRNNYMLAIVTYTAKKGDKVNLNEELLLKGYAWKNKFTDDKKYEKLEKQARKNKAGLWRNSDPTPPWEYRKRNR
jgi:endonuclease YncB( thermonuclease family)